MNLLFSDEFEEDESAAKQWGETRSARVLPMRRFLALRRFLFKHFNLRQCRICDKWIRGFHTNCPRA